MAASHDSDSDSVSSDSVVADTSDHPDATLANARVLANRAYRKAGSLARWMDLLGDYAGTEHFIIDGEALFQIVLDDPLLSIGQNARSFQIMHAYYGVEKLLQEYVRRGANFDIVFWDDMKYSTLETEGSKFAMVSRILARSMMFGHLRQLPCNVHVFEGLHDPKWKNYVFIKKPMFAMTNSGRGARNAAAFLQRAFLLAVLSSGISVALLDGAEYRNSKIFTFVYESFFGLSVVSRALQNAMSLARTSLQAKFPQPFSADSFRLQQQKTIVPLENGIKCFLEESILLLDQDVPPEMMYLFLVHLLLVPSLSIQQRSQYAMDLPPGLDELQYRALSPVYLNMASTLSSKALEVDVDGAVYTALLSFVLVNDIGIEEIVGHLFHRKARKMWKSINGPELKWQQFRSKFRPMLSMAAATRKNGRNVGQRALLPFMNPVFTEAFSCFNSFEETFNLEHTAASPGNNILFVDDKHWHNQRSILPPHLGGTMSAPKDPRMVRRMLRSNQRFMTQMQGQAATLTGAAGAILQQMIITSASKSQKSLGGNHNGGQKYSSKKADMMTSREKLKSKIKDEKLAESKKIAEAKWIEHLSSMATQSHAARLAFMSVLSRNEKLTGEWNISVEMGLYRIQLEIEMWIADSTRETPGTRDRYTVSLMKMVQEMCRRTMITLRAKKALTALIIVLGFGEAFAENLLSKLEVSDQPSTFSFIKLIRSSTKSPLSEYDFMAITEHPIIWQLRLFGDFMDRSMDSAPDKRVTFEPDAWQRKVLDGIDKNKSLLVVAPTSAGKTFISFYAMEKVLRESDDGILVYVAPTKALVTQITAEVYARFSKNLNGKSCWAISTRDFRIHNPQDCQILVTVPEMLGIMLFSPPLARTWAPRIKRIILDEIHSIGQEDVGAAWEQIVLLAPCPIIGLSATIGSPEVFSNWLESVQLAHGFEYEFIEHHHRYSHLRKFNYLPGGAVKFKSLNDHEETSRIKFMHPMTALLFGTSRMPSDLSLEATDCLSLYYALSGVKDDVSDPLVVDELKPEVFFSSCGGLLRQKDILTYESRLKDIVNTLLQSFDARDQSSPLGRAIANLDKNGIPVGEDGESGKTSMSETAITEEILTLLCDLHAKNDLPAILFSFDRHLCEVLGRQINHQLETAENAWRSKSPVWSQKMKEWRAWQADSKVRMRNEQKANKNRKKDQEEDARDSPETYNSFDPDEPSPQFSFAGRCASYSMTQLDEDIEAIKWASIPSWAIAALRRGIAVHHAGMNKHYRGLIENLFRKGFIRVMIATGTLALGINAPAKTSVFVGDSPYLTALMYRQCAGRAGRRGFDLRGNVIFFGMAIERVRRLVLSRLPTLGSHFPFTVTTVLRLLNLLSASDNADVAVRAVKSLLSLPQITSDSDFGKDQLLHHIRFSVEYLRRSGLVDHDGNAIDYAAIASHLFYTEPSNLALVTLLKSGVLRRICNQTDKQNAKKQFMLVMCNLFARRYLSAGFVEDGHLEELTKKYPSMVMLTPMPDDAQKVLKDHDEEILQTFQGYAFAFSRRMGTVDDTLPLSKLRITGSAECSLFHSHLRETAIPVVVRSPFVANSGHDDSFASVSELTNTSRAGLHLNHHSIPTMSGFTQSLDIGHRLNAYIMDFYVHGQVSTLVKANGIRRGDIWYLLQDFSLTLKVVQAALQQLLSRSKEDDETLPLREEDDDKSMSGDVDVNEEDEKTPLNRPRGVLKEDWRMLQIITQVCVEFDAKFKAMWA